MILIEQSELWSVVADFQHAIFNARSFQFDGRAVHRFDGFVRRIIRRRSGVEILFELIQSRLKPCHYHFPLATRQYLTATAEPLDNHGAEWRCYMCDPDGYLIGVGQYTPKALEHFKSGGI